MFKVFSGAEKVNVHQMRGFRKDWLIFLIVTILLLGVFFRFANLEQKVYWNDEAYTLLRLSGHTESELVQQEFNGQVIRPFDLKQYQQLNPDKTVVDTIRSQAVENTQHPPLYYILAWYWTHWFGGSIGVLRGLSALLSLLVFPALYWLCWELFQSATVGWMAVALMAVSPFHVVYAQEARQYSLWTVAILLSSAALLRSMRQRSVLNWAIYAVTLALGLYTFLLTIAVIAVHAVYVFAVTRLRWSKTLAAYLLASLGSLLLFSPWLVVLFNNLSLVRKTTNWTAREDLELVTRIKTIVTDLSHVFIDSASNFCIFSPDNSASAIHFENYLKYPVFLLIGVAFYVLCRKTPLRVWLFVVLLAASVLGPFVAADVLLGGVRSTTPRYLIPSYLGIGLAVAFLLANQLQSLLSRWQQWLWRTVTVGLLSLGILSCVQFSQAPTWWNKYTDCCTPWIASVVNSGNQPLLINSHNSVDTDLGHLLTLSQLLKQNVRLQLVTDSVTPKLPEPLGDVFLYRPSPELMEELSKRYRFAPVNGYDKFQRLVK